MKACICWVLIVSSGMAALLFVLLWIDHDFEYAWDKFQALVDEALT